MCLWQKRLAGRHTEWEMILFPSILIKNIIIRQKPLQHNHNFIFTLDQNVSVFVCGDGNIHLYEAIWPKSLYHHHHHHHHHEHQCCHLSLKVFYSECVARYRDQWTMEDTDAQYHSHQYHHHRQRLKHFLILKKLYAQPFLSVPSSSSRMVDRLSLLQNCWSKQRQDSVSTMQKTGWTNYSPYLVSMYGSIHT